MMKMNSVSVIMPCYNDGLYIKDAISSVQQQTYSYVELIIIDDGSNDAETIKTIQEFSTEDWIRVLHTNHLGPAAARNAGINVAVGMYILPVDADDIIEPTYIEKAVEILDKSANIGVVYCYAELFGEKKGRWELPDYEFKKMLLDNIIFVTALFRKCAWIKAGGFNVEMKNGMEDYDFWLSMLELGYDIYQIPEVLFRYRIKPISRTSKFINSYADVQATYRQIYFNHLEFYQKHHQEYALVLRESLIDKIFLCTAMEKSVAIINKCTKIPILKKILKRFILN